MKIKTQSRIKKTLKYFLIFLVVVTVILSMLANRDLIKIYGGLTQRVDSKQFDLKSAPIVINNINILSPNGEYFIPNQTVAIDKGLITSISSIANNSRKNHTINGEDKFLIPGLTDAHVHLFKSPNDLLLYVANGVTQIRELIGEEDHLLWRSEINDKRIAPDMFIASPRIGSFGAFEGFFMEWSQGFLNITNARQAEVEVKKLYKLGYDAVKIYSHINKESYDSVTKTAKSLGMKVVGHVPFDINIKDVYYNQDDISHLEELMNAINREFGNYGYDNTQEFLSYVKKRSPKIADNLLKNDISVTTTLWLVESYVRQKTDLGKVLKEVELEYENPGISEWSTTTPRGLGWLPNVNRYKWPDDWDDVKRAGSKKYWETYAKACQIIFKVLVTKGVKIMAGTDANLPPTIAGFSLHDELISLNNAGMTSVQTLRSATATPSNWLNNNAGVISIGRKANLILLDKNPLNNIKNTKAINSVILNGQLLDRELLDKMLRQVKNANDSSRTQDISSYSH